MSSRTISSVVGCLIAAGFALGAVQGCGSSSSSGGGNVMAVCMQGCTKLVPCLADAGFPETVAQCVQNCTAAGSNDGGTCTNESAIISAAQACAAKTTCTELEACGATIPQCETSGSGGSSGTGTGGTSGAAGAKGTGGTSGAAGAKGTGGTSGGGGTSGAAGGSGSASCSICDKAATCCTAVGEPAATCAMLSAASCNAMTGAGQTGFISDCQMVLTAGAALSSACK